VIVGLVTWPPPDGPPGHCFRLGLLAHGTDEAEALAGLDQTLLRTGAADRASGRVDWRCQCRIRNDAATGNPQKRKNVLA
jgi:hypothetical protein